MAHSDFISLGIFGGMPDSASQDPALDLGEYVSEMTTRNELSYNQSPTRMNNMTLYNDEEAFYVPTITFKLGYLGVSAYEKLMQLINSKGFVVKYFDQELGEYVYRAMYVTDNSLEALYVNVGNLDGLLGVSIKFVSRYGYAYVACNNENYMLSNKYHMAQLHLCKDYNTFVPTGEEYPNYV